MRITNVLVDARGFHRTSKWQRARERERDLAPGGVERRRERDGRASLSAAGLDSRNFERGREVREVWSDERWV